MTGFTVEISDGTTLTENDFSSWSGTMIIGNPTITQSIVLEGTPISVSGTATITWITPNVEGIFHLTDPSGTHDINFTISGNNLDTYSGVLPFAPGLTFEEWDYWVKLSDAHAAVRVNSMEKKEIQSTRTNAFGIGDLIAR